MWALDVAGDRGPGTHPIQGDVLLWVPTRACMRTSVTKYSVEICLVIPW